MNIIYSLVAQACGSDENPRAKLQRAMEFAVTDAIETIFTYILTIILLREKYYIHHIISLILYILLCLTIDYILGNFSEVTTHLPLHVILFIICLSLDATIAVYEKYMMEILFYSPWSVMFANGLYSLFNCNLLNN